jgi:hypothetical protein
MADKEKIKFLIKLYSEYFDKTPQVSILLNNKIMIEKQDIKGTSDNPDILEFTQELESDQTYEFIIRREGKDKTQTIVENGKIIKDQLLHIDAIEIDEIDLGGLIYEGVYVPNYSEPWATQQKNAGIKLPESFKNVTCMGHNGEWKLKFSSPFYMWLLENLY